MTAQGLFKARGREPRIVAVRRANDFYPTPESATLALLEHELGTLRAFGAVWEPCAGDGAIIDVLNKAGIRTTATDIAPRRSDIVGIDVYRCRSAFDPAVVTNPPFSEVSPRSGGAPLIHHLLVTLRVPYLALLLPATWMWAWRRRGAFLSAYPPARVLPVTTRIDWDGRGNPASDHAWHVWQAGHHGPTQIVMPEPPHIPTAPETEA